MSEEEEEEEEEERSFSSFSSFIISIRRRRRRSFVRSAEPFLLPFLTATIVVTPLCHTIVSPDRGRSQQQPYLAPRSVNEGTTVKAPAFLLLLLRRH